MRTKRLIATATAAAIAAGALTVSATTASAYGPGPGHHAGKDFGKDIRKDFGRDFGKKQGNGFHPGWGFPAISFSQGGLFFSLGGQKVCTPVYAQKWDWNPWQGWVLKTVKVDEKCTVKPYGFGYGW